MATSDECTIRIIGRYQSQNIVNTMHYRITDQVSGEKDVLQSLCDAWITFLRTAWTQASSDAYTLVGVKTFGKTGVSKTPGVLADGTAGLVAGDGAPASVCRTITLYTGDVKHRRRGRVMMSGTPVAQLDAADGSVTAAAKLLMDTIGALLVDVITAGGDEFTPGIPAAGADLWQNFTDYKSRETPSLVKSRRIREFLIG